MVAWVSVAVAGVVVVVAVAALGFLLTRRLRRVQSQAVLIPEGYQEARVTINGRYRPGTLRVQQGVPVRIRFLRMEDNPCSERVIFAGFGIDRRLPAFQETTVELVPTTTGTFLFTCQLGMYRGKLVVTPARGRSKAAQTVKPEEKRGVRTHGHSSHGGGGCGMGGQG